MQSIEYDNKIKKSSREYAKNEYHPRHENRLKSLALNNKPNITEEDLYNRGCKEGITKEEVEKLIQAERYGSSVVTSAMEDTVTGTPVSNFPYTYRCWLVWDMYFNESISENDSYERAWKMLFDLKGIRY